jgi:pSer/pThr/pTyr-binding forkhead associated (FHA) protein
MLAAQHYLLRRDAEEIEVPATGLVLGRSASCQLQLVGGLVSRRHARLAHGAEGLVVEDLGSRNGVFVNQRRIVEAHAPRAR